MRLPRKANPKKKLELERRSIRSRPNKVEHEREGELFVGETFGKARWWIALYFELTSNSVSH
jgi:hypothetical protein